MSNQPYLIRLAGPNGAGKSTFYSLYFSKRSVPFLNADLLAKKYNIDSYKAAEKIACLRDELVRLKMSLITETVLSDPVGAKVTFLKSTKAKGFDVTLVYIGIPSSGFSARRVSARVEAGGHDVPLEKIQNRYDRTFINLDRAIKLGLHVRIYDNTSIKNPYRFLAEFDSGKLKRQTQSTIPDWAKRITP